VKNFLIIFVSFKNLATKLAFFPKKTQNSNIFQQFLNGIGFFFVTLSADCLSGKYLNRKDNDANTNFLNIGKE